MAADMRMNTSVQNRSTILQSRSMVPSEFVVFFIYRQLVDPAQHCRLGWSETAYRDDTILISLKFLLCVTKAVTLFHFGL
uniref:Uncharacterized protein n=1 Tax=Arundo donax TaxID=35708 RepID=A0A0A9FB10_ARUDO